MQVTLETKFKIYLLEWEEFISQLVKYNKNEIELLIYTR